MAQATMKDIAWVRHWLDLVGSTAPEAFGSRVNEVAASLAALRKKERDAAFEEAAALIESDKIPEVESFSVLDEPGVVDLQRRKATAEMTGVASAMKQVMDFKIDSYARSIRRLKGSTDTSGTGKGSET